MNTPKHQKQLNALVKYISETSSAMLVDGRMCWEELKPFCVTCRGKSEIDTWHHGDEGVMTPERTDRL
eukprot:7375024-Alexandrium_andersonii.AAC.1